MTYDYKNHPLPILISSRVRLTDDQRREVKDAYYKRKNQLTQPVRSNNHTGLVVETASIASDLDKQLGFTSIVFTDLVNSRDTISMNILLRLQEVLGVSLITKKELIDACKNYADYVFLKAKEENS